MKNVILLAALLLLAAGAESQGKNSVTTAVKVYGNCAICEAAIEKAGTVKGAAQTDWNKDTKMATLRYDAKRITKEALLKRIALAGYDNETYLAPDEAYGKLQSCCQYKREKKLPALATANPPANQTGKPAGHEGHVQQPATQAGQVQVLLENYFALKDALVKSDAGLASAKAVALHAGVNEIKMERLSTNEHTVWMKIYKDITLLAGQISNAAGLDKQREYFAGLSEKLYEIANVSKPAGIIYYQHCPMYNDGKGANWLSRESAIKNPYYGSMMLSCGKIVETIGQ